MTLVGGCVCVRRICVCCVCALRVEDEMTGKTLGGNPQREGFEWPAEPGKNHKSHGRLKRAHCVAHCPALFYPLVIMARRRFRSLSVGSRQSHRLECFHPHVYGLHVDCCSVVMMALQSNPVSLCVRGPLLTGLLRRKNGVKPSLPWPTADRSGRSWWESNKWCCVAGLGCWAGLLGCRYPAASPAKTPTM